MENQEKPLETSAPGFPGGGEVKIADRSNSAKRNYSYLIEFRCRGTLVFSEKTENLGDCVKIGHSPENDWVIPPEDKQASDFHAQLRLTPKDINLIACKGESFRFKGKPATQRKLMPGDRISMGDCELLVSYAEPSSNMPCDVHRLEFLNGERAGDIVRLEKGTVRIGCAKDNDIVINDDVVSAYHAELKIASDGETWLRDLNSQNGTFVNGAKMGKTERMLMDSDVVSVAFYDLRFLDRNVIHTRTNISKKLFAILLTTLAVAAVFAVFYFLTPRSESLLGEYDAQLKNNDFGGARSTLSQLPYSRDFRKFAADYTEYQDSLSRYETVFQVYEEFKKHLGDSNWAKATACLGLLNLDKQVDWNWNEALSPKYMNEAIYAKTCLIEMYALSNALSDTDLPAEKMKAELAKFEKSDFVKPEFEKSAPDYLKPLCNMILQKASYIRKNVENLDKLDNLLNGINWENADIPKLLEEVRAIEYDSMGGVRIKAQNTGEILRKISGNIKQVRLNQENFYRLNFDAIVRDIDFISSDECLNYAQISNLRDSLVMRNSLILKNIDALKYVIASLRECGIDNGIPKLVEEFNSMDSWNSLLSFKSLDNPQLADSKSDYADEYDKLLGFKYFYDIIAQIPTLSTNVFSNGALLPEEYHPKCVQLSEIYKSAEEANAWFSIPDNKWMLKDKILAIKKKVENILSMREKLLLILDKIAGENPDGRKYFVAKAAYFYFSRAGSISKDEMDDFSQKWRIFRQKQYTTWEKYNPIDSGNMKKIKSEILSKGIPGDPIVNSLWKK